MLDCSMLSMENGNIGDSILSAPYLMIHSASHTLKKTQISAVSVQSGRFCEEHASYPMPLIAKMASTYLGKHSVLLALLQPAES